MNTKLQTLSLVKNKKGFTLVEIIISFAILSIVVLMVFSMQSFGLKVFNTGSDRYHVQSGTGIVTEYITQKLRYAFSVSILENASLVPASDSISNNDAYIFVKDGTEKDRVLFRDKNGTSELYSFESCQLVFSTVSLDRSLSFNISGVLNRESFDVDSGIVSLNLLLDNERKITFQGSPGITSGSAVKIVRDYIAAGGSGLLFTPNPPNGTVGSEYDYSLGSHVTGGTGPYTYTSSPRFPYGISLNATNGELDGDPIEPGEFSIIVIVKDSSTPQLVGHSIIEMTVHPETPLSSDAPKAGSVSISGNIAVGGTLTANYNGCIDPDGDDIVTPLYQWYTGPNADGTGTLASIGSNSPNYTITASDLNKYIFVKVTLDGSIDGLGMPVYNTYPLSTTLPVDNAAPEAKNLAITGMLTVGSALTGSYDYYDADTPSDVQGITSFQWYRASRNNGSDKAKIVGATGQTYTLTTADRNQYIYFAVTPKAVTGILEGNEVISANVGKIN